MSTIVAKKRQTRDTAIVDKDVYTLAVERVHRTYDLFDNIAVAFSGGKDSTAVLNVTLDVAKERQRLPLEVVFFDEECCTPETIDYMRRVNALPEINLHWFCLPVMHRNACSTTSPYWYPWDTDCPELWVRELPPEGITKARGFKRQTIPEFAPLWLGRQYVGTVAFLMGIRADESLVRRRGLTHRRTDNYITPTAVKQVSYVKPIYDWRTDDVWTGAKLFGWDYNRTYDLMKKVGISHFSQRIAPPYGEQPMLNLWMWKYLHPELWDKMVRRVPGAAAAARYSTTQLYGRGSKVRPQFGMSWEESIDYHLNKHPKNIQTWASRRIRKFMDVHFREVTDPIPEVHAHPVTGLSWTLLLRVAMLGDLKSRTDPKMKSKGRKNVENLD